MIKNPEALFDKEVLKIYYELMIRMSILIALYFLLICCSSNIRTAKVSDNITVLNARSANLSVINWKSELIIIDTLYSPKIAEKAKGIIESMYPGKITSTVINTHGHYDHTFGNQVFSDADIYAHRNALYLMKMGVKLPEVKKVINDTGNTPFRMTSATRVVDEEKLIVVNGLKLYLFWFGNGHSSSDLLIAVPDLKALFVGDIFFRNGFPKFKTYRGNNWHPGNWSVNRFIDVLNRVLKLSEYRYIISGHGLLVPPGKLECWRDYFIYLKRDIMELAGAGEKEKIIIEKISVKPWYKDVFKKLGFEVFPDGHHRSFIRHFYLSLKAEQNH